MLENLHRDEFLLLDDQALQARCDIQATKGSGPGGQHRNKTSTGVRVALPVFNLEIRCCEDRSAHVNRLLALRRLRLAMALSVRLPAPKAQIVPFPGSQGHVQSSNEAFPFWIADVMDRLQAYNGELRPVAELYGLSTTALGHILSQEKAILQAVQQIRRIHGHSPIRST